MRTITTLSSEVPAASRQCFSAFSEASVCVSMSPRTISPVTMSTGGVAEMNTKPLAFTAVEQGRPSARTLADMTGTSMTSFFIGNPPFVYRELIAPPAERQSRAMVQAGSAHATATHSISISNSIGHDATGTKVRDGGFSGKCLA